MAAMLWNKPYDLASSQWTHGVGKQWVLMMELAKTAPELLLIDQAKIVQSVKGGMVGNGFISDDASTVQNRTDAAKIC